MIINSSVKKILHKIEENSLQVQLYLELIEYLKENCQFKIFSTPIEHDDYFKPYPITDYAEAIDPILDENKLLDYWHTYGFVVAKNIFQKNECDLHLFNLQKIFNHLSMDLNDAESWVKDDANTPILSRGFLDIYHHNILAQIRQNIRLYLYHVILWNTPYLWTSFDRIGVKPCNGESSKGLPLHVDQNLNIHPNFQTIQGSLALNDNPLGNANFVVVPQSHLFFSEYKNSISTNYKGEYVQLNENHKLYKEFNTYKQSIPVKKGNMISWDSRTTHCNGDNKIKNTRFVIYVSAGIVKNDHLLMNIRKEAFKTGCGENFREAYLHASKKPRFNNQELLNNIREKEELTWLGECLYGLRSYEDNP